MGIATGTGGEVFPNLEIREITDAEINEMGYIFMGLDFGFAVDPCACMRVAYDRKTDTVYFLMKFMNGTGQTGRSPPRSSAATTTGARK